MSSFPSVEDLRLVLAIGRTASVGSAARELQVSQPSASQRLARLERRIGVRLFERDTRGARPTAAGTELIAQARHILGHLEGVYDATLAAASADRLVMGTFASLASALFPVLDEHLTGFAVEQRIDHGPQLVEWVAEGTMDAAFIAIADQLTLPPGVTAHTVGYDRLVLFLAAGVEPPRRGKQPLKDRQVAYSTYDMGSEELRSRLIALGAHARRGVTLGTTIAMARRRRHLALLPRSAVADWLLTGERVLPAPFRYRLTLSAVTGRNPPAAVLDVLPRVRRELGLSAVRR